jgi:hypothetical protein
MFLCPKPPSHHHNLLGFGKFQDAFLYSLNTMFHHNYPLVVWYIFFSCAAKDGSSEETCICWELSVLVLCLALSPFLKFNGIRGC